MISNPNVVYAEPSHGNHFGFVEGERLMDALTGKECYVYPAKVAIEFFGAVSDVLS